MSKILVITEKPSQSKALVQGLYDSFKYVKYDGPSGYWESDNTIVVPAQGHLFSLLDIPDYLVKKGELQKKDNGKYNWREFSDKIPYIPEKFEYKTTNSHDATQFQMIKQLIDRNDVEMIYNFGDPDAEGELLIREILMMAGNRKKVKRMETKSLVPSILADAYYHPYDINNYNSLYFEALARQQTDWLTGINYTTMLTLKSGIFFPVGRVLVPIVRYVYDSVKAHNEFVPDIFYGINFSFIRNKKKFTLSASDPEIKFDKSQKNDCEELQQAMQSGISVVTKVEKKKKNLNPKKLFNTTQLLSFMSNKYKISIDDTQKALQKLYEDARIMYPRTDCEYLQTSEIDNTRKIIEGLSDMGYPVTFHTKKSVFNDEKCGAKGEGGHTAIIITNKFYSEDEFMQISTIEQAVYLAIFNRTVANFCDNPDIDETIVTITNDSTKGKYNFTLSGTVTNSEGFLEFEPRTLNDELPMFYEGEVLESTKFETARRKTKAPPMPTQNSLLFYLEHPFAKMIESEDDETDDNDYYDAVKKGITIGTANATMATTITKAIKYDYITQTKGQMDITTRGKVLIETLDRLGISELNAERTIDMNKKIKLIGNRAYSLEQNKEDIKWELINASNNLKARNIVINADDLRAPAEKIGNCPKCGSPVYEGEKSFYCSNKECKFYLYKEDAFFKNVLGKKITKTMAKGFLSSKRQAKVTSIASKKKMDENGKPKKYDAYIKVDFTDNGAKFSFGEFTEKKKRRKII